MKRFVAITVFALSFFIAGAGVAQESKAQPDLTIDNAQRAELLEAIIKNLNDYYVSRETAAEIEKAVRERWRRKEYDQITSAAEFAKTLTTQVREVSRDQHLSVNYSSKVIPVRQEPAAPTAEEREGLRNYGEAINFGFEKVERLPGNIGYIRLNLFFPTEYGGDTAVATMKFVAGTQALIIDLRDNDGGQPNMIVLLASYLFGDEPVQLNGLYRRKTNSIQPYWTMPYVPGARYTGKDVYLLTSKRTFSGGEAFAYDLKNLKRATLIGETTAGAANPRDVFRIHEHFWLGIPTARPVNPVTNTNWESVGVKPDVEVPAEFALKTAQLVALKKFVESSTNDDQKSRLNKLIETIQKELDELKKKP